MNRQSRLEILAFFLMAFGAFIGLCVHGQDPRDFLDPAVEPRNACGPVGAAVGLAATSWLGTAGAYGASGLLALLGVILFFRRRIEQWPWKVIGSLLLVLVLCAFEVAVIDATGDARGVPGGYLGWSFYTFLLAHLSEVGTYLILTLITLVAFVITTDTLLYPAFARSHHLLFRTRSWPSVARFLGEHRPRLPRVRFGGVTRFLGEFREKRRVAREAAREAREERTMHSRRAVPDGGVVPGGRASAGRPERREDEEPDEKVNEAEAPDALESHGGETEEDFLCPRTSSPPFAARQTEFFDRPRKKPSPKKKGPYQLPPLTLIEPTPTPSGLTDKAYLSRTAEKIESTLREFKIEAQVVQTQKGPTITQFEVSLAAGIKVHKIVNLSDDLAMALKAQSIRIIAPIPGKATVGIEVPNRTRSMVGVRELIALIHERARDYTLPLALGRDTAGQPVIADVGDMPHLLIAGSTGSGKSVCINSIVTSVLMTRTPDEVKMILVDPKMVELAQFASIPHLLSPVVSDMKKAPAVLNWLVEKMDERYELLALASVRHITSYNALGPDKLKKRLASKLGREEIEKIPDHIPFVVVIIDELADLMMTAAKEVEGSITRLSQKSRAVGIHVILATQRPSVDVITGLIKANMPSRISFRVTSRVDSRTILDGNGAEKLLGKGDMLFVPPGTSDVIRVQGAFISDREIRDLVKYTAESAEPQYNPELTKFGIDGAAGDPGDELFDEAVRIVLGSQRGSVTLLQRQLQIGYTRASRLMEILHERGLVGPFKGSKAREVYYTLEDWEKQKGRAKSSADASE
ncbi:MAG: DNA translocase FtsK 4TM domain-containing protein [Planctomycetota bacterium]|nr:DNA translocase FtsK 4TM domain-containing protein [Planctomycetota bacterium]